MLEPIVIEKGRPLASLRLQRVKGPAQTKSTKTNMNQRSLSCNCTEEDDRRTRAKWMCTIPIFYGCMALLVFGLVVLTKASSVAPNETAHRQTWSADLQNERTSRNPDVSWRAR
jgi:hypothetical protein